MEQQFDQRLMEKRGTADSVSYTGPGCEMKQNLGKLLEASLQGLIVVIEDNAARFWTAVGQYQSKEFGEIAGERLRQLQREAAMLAFHLPYHQRLA